MLCLRSAGIEQQCRRTFYLGRIQQLQSSERLVQDVASHIAQSTRTIIPPSAPVPGMIDFVIWIHLGRTGKQIPVQGFGNAVFLFGNIQSLRPDGTVGSTFHLRHVTDFAVPYPLAYQVGTLVRRTLVTHLGNYSRRSGQAGKQTGLIYGVRQRFLAIYMFAHRHGISSNDGMCMVGSSDDNGIDVLTHLIVHLTIVPILLRIGKLIEHTFRVAPVYVTKRHDIFRSLHMVDVGVSHTADTYGGNVQTVTGRHVSVALTQNAARSNGKTRQSQTSGLKKFSSCKFRHGSLDFKIG